MTILQALYFILPAYLANMAPVLMKWIPAGDYPVDRGRTWRGQRIFGDNKTYRGLISGSITGIITVFLQKKISPALYKINIIQYDQLTISQIILVGLAFGLGALLGDLVKSFFKRQFDIMSGKIWFPFDQLDFVIGALLAVSLFYIPPIKHIIIIILITPPLHFLTNSAAYFIKLKKVWW